MHIIVLVTIYNGTTLQSNYINHNRNQLNHVILLAVQNTACMPNKYLYYAQFTLYNIYAHICSVPERASSYIAISRIH